MGEIERRTRFRNNHRDDYNGWWNCVHLLKCDAEDFPKNEVPLDE